MVDKNRSDDLTIPCEAPKSKSRAYWFMVPDELDPLMELGATDLKVCLVLMRAIQRDQNRGRISVRQVAERAHIKSIGHVQEAISRLCAAGWFSRHNVHTGASMTRPEQWKGREIEYRQEIEWRRRDTENCSLERNTLPEEEPNCSPERNRTVPQNGTELFPRTEQHREVSSSELREESSSKAAGDVKPTNDEIPFSKKREPEPQSEAVTVVQESTNTDDTQEGKAGNFVPTVENLDQARKSLAAHRGMVPDIAITRKVLRKFGSMAEFWIWRADIEKRLPADRITGRFGIYLTDAGTFTEAARQEAAEKQRARTEHAAKCPGWILTIPGTELIGGREIRVFAASWCDCDKGRELAKTRGDEWLDAELDREAARRGGMSWLKASELRHAEKTVGRKVA